MADPLIEAQSGSSISCGERGFAADLVAFVQRLCSCMRVTHYLVLGFRGMMDTYNGNGPYHAGMVSAVVSSRAPLRGDRLRRPKVMTWCRFQVAQDRSGTSASPEMT